MTNRLLSILLVLAIGSLHLAAQGLGSADMRTKRADAVEALTTIDENLVSYFPRWKLCEPDLTLKLKHIFKVNELRPSDEGGVIRITAAPKSIDEPDKEYDVLLIQWGSFHADANMNMAPGQMPDYVTLNAQDIRTKIPQRLADILSGRLDGQGYDHNKMVRSYCFHPLDTKQEPTQEEVREMVNFFQPTAHNHAMSISAFEQALKLGQGPSQVWLYAQLGTDAVGLPFWTSGEGRIVLRMIPIGNENYENNSALPSILALRLGFGYRIAAGLEGQNQLLDFIAPRKMDAGPGGKVVAGFDFNFPGMEEFGLTFNAELPLKGLGVNNEIGNLEDYVPYETIIFDTPDQGAYADSTVYLLRATGQVSLFYNWWPDKASVNHFFRFDLGMNYNEIQQTALLRKDPLTPNTYALVDDAKGLELYHPVEALDWIYAKIEYFNQSGRPFGISAQYSNQILTSRVFVPLIGSWLYLEAKYSKNLRSPEQLELRPFDFNSFFMISPVLRFSI